MNSFKNNPEAEENQKAAREREKDKVINYIAKNMRIETLETRHRDSLDFHDISVWELKSALKAAYEAGENK